MNLRHTPLAAVGSFIAVLLLTCAVARASDHADPMSLNVFKVLQDPETNITDLHAFIVDGQHQRITDSARLNDVQDSDQLILSLCVRRSLRPDQIGDLKLSDYTFRLHLDYDAPVLIIDPAKLRDGRNYVQAREQAATPEMRSALVTAQERDMLTQALYGGVITDPAAIGEEAIIDVTLRLETKGTDDEQAQAFIHHVSVQNLQGAITPLSLTVPDSAAQIIKADLFKPGGIYAVAGVFDDPFIFPRFFRSNVVGVVISLPVKALRNKHGRCVLPAPLVRDSEGKEKPGPCPLLIWATTHKGKTQIDHVGRSLRTQLPRFGYLNDKHPSQHVQEIGKVHDRPNLIESITSTVIAPLIAHRHYDSTPDVMIYDLSKPATFPNGRWFEDDVAKTLADAGETLLLELSHSESPQFPRATTNDKPFRQGFPFLAPRWTKDEQDKHKLAGLRSGAFEVPRARDAAATATPDLHPTVWQSLWLGELLLLLLLTALCVWLAHRDALRLVLLILTGVMVWWLHGLLAPKAMPLEAHYFMQPAHKFMIVVTSMGYILLLVLAVTFLWGRRRGVASTIVVPADPAGLQEQTAADENYSGTSFNEVRDVIFRDPYYGPVWEQPGKLPVYPVSFLCVAQGLLSRLAANYFPFGNAATRTIKSHADLRPGTDGRGVKRLLHPNGLCLTGRWKIDPSAPADYTGGFSPDTDCLIIGRYSTCCTETRSGRNRSLSLVGKLYATDNPDAKQRTKSFITQEDIGGNLTHSIFQGVTFNAPGVTPTKRDFSGFFAFLVTAVTFLKTDREPTIRQLYEIAELGVDQTTTKIVCPKFMRLTPALPHPAVPEAGTDFRDEILGHIYQNGARKNKLIFDIAVADQGELTGLLFQKLEVRHKDWKTIGRIEFDQAVASPGGDHVIHFHHPAWRTDIADQHTASGPPDTFIVRLLKRLIP